jgi:hypothetical protein
LMNWKFEKYFIVLYFAEVEPSEIKS